MNQADRDRLVVLKKAKKKLITQKDAALELAITERQVRRLLKALKQRGDRAVIHALRGKRSNRKIDEKTKKRALEILSTKDYEGFRPTLASEHLNKRFGIEVSRETVRQWMTEGRIWRPRRQRVEKVHQWRPRRSRRGELVQWDTSDHDWLEGRGPKLKLILMIDDATSRWHARFVMHDSTESNMQVLEEYLLEYGRPLAFYTDKASLFQTAEKRKRDEPGVEKDAVEMPPTQIGRALQELGIVWIAAHSPQAKGRVERSFQTAQDRLVREMRIAKVSRLEEANRFLIEHFLPWANRELTVAPASADDAHRPLNATHNLAAILSHVMQRRVDNDYTFPLDGKRHQIVHKDICTGLRRAVIRVEKRRDGTVAARFGNRYLETTECAERPKPARAKKAAAVQPKPRAPRPSSRWNESFDLHSGPKIWQAARASGARPAES